MPAAPTMMQAAPIIVRGQNMGRVEVVASARPLWINTGIVAALSCLLGFGMYFVIRVVPLRVLNRALDALARTQRNLQDQNSRFDAALNNMSQGLIMFDAAERIVVCNNRYIEMYGLSRDIVKPGCTLRDLLAHRAALDHKLRDPEEYRAELLAKLSLGKTVEGIVETADGRTVALTNRPMPNGGWVVTHEDISERRRAEAKIAHMSLHDALTNLPNRTFFREQLENRLAHLPRGQEFAVMCRRYRSLQDRQRHAWARFRRHAATARGRANDRMSARGRYPCSTGRR